MKSILLIITFFISSFLFSQDTISLSQNYFIEATYLTEGRLTLKKWTYDTNEDAKKDIWYIIYCGEDCEDKILDKDSKYRIKNTLSEEEYKKYKEKNISEEVSLSQGTYRIQNIIDGFKKEEIIFTIDGKGRFEKILNRGKLYIFKEGNLVRSEFLHDKNGYETWEDNIYIRTEYYANGNRFSTIKIDNSIQDKNSNTIKTIYDQDGKKVLRVINSFTKINQAFYANGKTKEYNDENKNIKTKYETDGSKMTEKLIVDENPSKNKEKYVCQEKYDSKNIITYKLCKSNNEKKEYTYHNGKLSQMKTTDRYGRSKTVDDKGNIINQTDAAPAPGYKSN